MKKQFLPATVLVLVFFLCAQTTSAQKNIIVAKPDCFSTNKNRGDDYRLLRKFDLAIQQYQAAKLCKSISRIQVMIADSLINLTTKQQSSNQRIILRKY
jgi:hypothetical protein